MKPVLSSINIKKQFQHPSTIEILKGISLDLFPGESIAIVGSSGEGKSTLLHILGTLEAPTSGELYISGKLAVNSEAPLLRNKHIGFVFQSFNLLEDYTVLQNVLMPSLIANQPIHKGSIAYQRGWDLLEKMGLKERGHFMTKLLSGGEKQRTCFARALLNDPEIILADEPTGNLDHENSKKIHDLLLSSVKDLNKSLIVVTHDPELADLCDRKLRLINGYLVDCM